MFATKPNPISQSQSKNHYPGFRLVESKPMKKSVKKPTKPLNIVVTKVQSRR